MEDVYLPRVRGGQWAVSRMVDGEWLALIEDRSLYHNDDAVKALAACKIPATDKNLDRYFPSRPFCGRCPTLEFLELFSKVGSGQKREVGV